MTRAREAGESSILLCEKCLNYVRGGRGVSQPKPLTHCGNSVSLGQMEWVLSEALDIDEEADNDS